MASPLEKTIICPTLIGRAAHLEIIGQLLEEVRRGRGQTLVIAGEAGLGKSRLVAETKLLASRQGWQSVAGYSFETARSLPYGPILDLLRGYAIGRSSAELAQAFGPATTELAGLLPELVPHLPAPSRTESESDKYRLFYAVALFCAHLAANRPLLLVVEDIHWSDEASFDLLLYLSRHLADQPILLLLTCRSEATGPALANFLAQLDRQRLATEITLSPLGQAQVAEMLQTIFEHPWPIRSDFLELIYDLTEGNPFFIEEILKSMVMSREIFFAGDGIWDRQPLPELHVPRSVQAAVQRRREQLSDDLWQLLTLAAVTGRRFSFSLLQHLAGQSEAELLSQLRQLIAAQFIVEESAEQFAFRHALTRQAVYATLLARERRDLHRAIGETLERLSAGAVEGHLVELADHFYRGEVWDKVHHYLQQAGQRAQALYAPHSAIEHFSLAIEASRHLATKSSPQLHYRRGLARASLSQFDPAQADYQTALALAQAQNDQRAEWQILLALGDLWTSRDYTRTGAYFQQALELARNLADDAAIARSLNYIGNWHMNQERPFAALRHHQEAQAIFELLADQAGLAQTLDLLAIASYNCGDLLQGRAYYQQALPLWQQLDDRQGLLHSLSGLALAGDFDLEFDDAALAEAVAWGQQAVQLAGEIGWRSGEVLALICLGLVWRHSGEYGQALAVLQRALAMAEDIEHREWQADAHRALGALYLDLLAPAEAQQHLEQTLALAREINSTIWLRQGAGTLAPIYIRLNELAKAGALLDEVLAPDAPMQSLQQRLIWGARVELALANDQPELALQLASRLIRATANLGPDSGRVVPRLWYLRGQALLAVGQFAQAEADLQAALAAAHCQSRRGIEWRLHATLARSYQAQGKVDPAEQELAAARRLIEELADTITHESLPAAETEPLRQNFRCQAEALLPVTPSLSPQQQAKQQFGGLTAREREVAALVAQGQTNRDIAETLILSERTAERHVANIMAKLGFNSRAQIAAWATEKGLTKTPSST